MLGKYYLALNTARKVKDRHPQTHGVSQRGTDRPTDLSHLTQTERKRHTQRDTMTSLMTSLSTCCLIQRGSYLPIMLLFSNVILSKYPIKGLESEINREIEEC